MRYYRQCPQCDSDSFVEQLCIICGYDELADPELGERPDPLVREDTWKIPVDNRK